MAHYYDITGEKYGRLTPLKLDRERMNEVKAIKGYSKTFWFCKCDCGTVKSVSYHGLSHGYTTSCGCARKKAGRKPKK